LIESIFVRSCAITKHMQGPFLRQREEYLGYLASRQKCPGSLQDIAMMLLHVIRVMEVDELRTVEEIEIQRAAERWAQEEDPHRLVQGRKASVSRFTRTARDWFRFQGLLKNPSEPNCFDPLLKEFIDAMRSTRNLSPETIQASMPRARNFLTWVATKCDQISSVSLKDVDEFLETKRKAGWRPRTLAAQSQVLRNLFGFLENRGWSKPGIVRGIRNPPICVAPTAVLQRSILLARCLLGPPASTTLGGLPDTT